MHTGMVQSTTSINSFVSVLRRGLFILDDFIKITKIDNVELPVGEQTICQKTEEREHYRTIMGDHRNFGSVSKRKEFKIPNVRKADS